MRRLARLLLIQEEENGQVLYFLLFFIVLGAGMAVGRASADALFLKRYGVEYLPLAFLGLSMFLGLASLVYAAVVDYLPAETFFRGILIILAALLFGSWACITFFPLSGIYPFYYLVYKVASELLLVHAALYVNQNFNTLQSKRLSPIIFSGAEIGALTGALFASLSAGILGVQNLLLVWLGIALCAIILLSLRHGRTGPSPFFRAQRKRRHPVRGSLSQLRGGLVFIKRSALLRYASLSLLFLVFAFYVLTYSVNKVYTETFTSEESLTVFLSILIAVNSILTLLIQVFVTNRALLRFGVQRMNLVFPVTTLASYIGLIAHFGLPTALLGSFNRDTLIEAIQNPVRSLFFNAVPHYMQGRARAVTVALVLPLGLIICGITLWFMQQLDSPLYFLVPGLVAAAGFLYYNHRMNHAYASELVDTLKERVFVPGEETGELLRAGGDRLLHEIGNSLRAHDALFLSNASRIINGFPDRAADYLLPELGRVQAGIADRLVRQLLPHRPEGLADAVRPLLNQPDTRLQTTALRTLVALADDSAVKHVQAALQSNNPRLRAAGVHGVLVLPCEAEYLTALQVWQALLQGNTQDRLAALTLFPELNRLQANDRERLAAAQQACALDLLQNGDQAIILRTLAACRDCQCNRIPGLEPAIKRLLGESNPDLRRSAIACANLLGDAERDTCLLRALEDGHASVREQAVEAIASGSRDLTAELSRWLIVENRGNPRAQKTLLQAGIRAGLPASQLKQLAEDKARDAHRLREAHRQMLAAEDQQDTETQLLTYMLDERYRDTLDMALLALEPLHESGRIGVIRAGISSGDERFVAGACEALSTLHKEPAAQQLSRLLQDSQRDSGRDAPFAGPDDALQWCRGWAGKLATAAETKDHTQHAVEETGNMATLNDRILLLKQSNLFSEVSTDDLRFVADALVESEYFPGERVFDIGEQGDQLYLIVKGSIGISLSPDPEAQEFVATIGTGEHFGEMNLLDDLPRSATAHVLEETCLLSLEKGRLRGLILSYPEISLGIMRGLSMVVRECHQRAAEKT